MKNSAEYIYALRNDYRKKSLEKADARLNPFEQFEIWMTEAIEADMDDPNAMVLATATADGKPSARIVLLRGFDRQGFVFFTNYDSQKSREIEENPQASLLFYWSNLERQIRLEGAISKTNRRLSQEYFASRPRASQIGAWASAQSRTIESRQELEEKISEAEKRFAGRKVDCPEFWGGYILKPRSFEFWQGRESRLHDRLRYSKTKSAWKIERLSP
jgi:pyridoxamine 5'-phosphate oxidase